jgi:uncharacterized spore protein YtfJ
MEAAMNPQQILTGAQDALTVRRVFGEPIQVDGSTILPVAKINGGGGAGGRGAEEGGVGYGISARPAGVYVIRNGTVRWRPAVDVNRVILGGQIVGTIAILTLGPIVRNALARRWKRDAPLLPAERSL